MWHLDYETYSAADLRKVGAYRYASDHSACILMLAIAHDYGEPLIWVPRKFRWKGLDCTEAYALMGEMVESDEPIWAHNAQFEAAISYYLWEKTTKLEPISIDRWRCTAALARRAAHPPKLEKLAEVLGLGQQKDKKGSALIRKFCVPVKKTGKRTLPGEKIPEFKEFTEYCLQDVRTEQEVHKKLHAFDMKGSCLDTFQFDMRMNQNGLPVNVDALLKAQELVWEIEENYGDRFRKITGGIQPGQRDVFLEWIRQYGYPGKNLQAPTVEECLRDTGWANHPKAVEALNLRQQLAFAAVRKIDSMLDCECGDGIVRGTLQYYGAGTGRAAGRLIQPQNFKRPSFKDTALAYSMICGGTTVADLELLYGNAMEAIASCIRHFIQMLNEMMLNADYAGIEARIIVWLADQFDALKEFRDYDAGKGPNAYELMASAIFDMPLKDIDKDGMERFIGKQTVLGCGFGMGVDKFLVTCENNGRSVEYEMGERAVGIFRKVRSKVVKFWYNCENAAKKAIQDPGTWYPAGTKVKFAVTESEGVEYLVMMLPSKRRIVYPWPRLEASKRSGRKQITFFGNIKGNLWGRVSTYGGKLAENATQGIAADIMFNGSVKAEAKGFQILTLIHDEALSRGRGGDLKKELQIFTKALCDLPAWAEGLPIVAEGKIVPYYLK